MLSALPRKRSLDLTLDALEANPSNHGLLRLVGVFSKDSIPHIVGFKLAHYRSPSVAKYHRATVRAALKNKASRAEGGKGVEVQ